MRWETVKLEDACSKIGSGATPNGGATNYISTGICFIRSQNVYNLHFENNGLAHITELAAKKLSNVTVYQNDVLLNITGDSVARTCLVPPDVLPARVNQHVAILRVDSNKLDPRFLCYFLASPNMQNYMLGLAVGKGASRNAMTKTMIGEFDIPYPSMETQKRIADILSAYDDLIENNQKQIKLLEEAARRLYKEWFINLRFPGHETTPIINGIPEGWERKTVEKCLVMAIGGGWGKGEPSGTYLHKGRVIRGTDIPDVYYGNYRDVPLRYHTEKDIRTRSLQENDIIFELSNGNIDNIGRCLLIDKEMLRACGENALCASFCKLLRPINEAHALLLFLEIQEMQYNGTMLPLKKHGANGINNFDFQGFLQHGILVPNNTTLLDPIKAIAAKISILREQLRLLTEARDRLLPKLMSGEIEV